MPPALTAAAHVWVLAALAWGRITQSSAARCRLTAHKPAVEYEYHQEGDVVIGGLFSAHSETIESNFSNHKYHMMNLCSQLTVIEYKSILTFIFTIEEINRNPDLLPNITLGYHIYDSCGDPKNTLGYAHNILSGHGRDVPNYSCRDRGEVAGVVGDSGFLTNLALAQFLSVYRYLQVGYRTTDVLLSDRSLYPTFYRTVQDDRMWNKAIIACLRHFGWNWVGIITFKDGTSVTEIEELRTMMAVHEICMAFVIDLSKDMTSNRQKMKVVKTSMAKVIIICGEFSTDYMALLEDSSEILQNITLILSNTWKVVRYKMDRRLQQAVNCSLVLVLMERYVPGLKSFMDGISLVKRPKDPILEEIWMQDYGCLSSNPTQNRIFGHFYRIDNKNCPMTRRLGEKHPYINSSKDYKVYTAVRAIAEALHHMNLHRIHSGGYSLRQNLPLYFRDVRFEGLFGETVFFNERGELPSALYLQNYMFNNAGKQLYRHNVGEFEESLNDTWLYDIRQENVIWKGGEIPQSRCNDRCSPGFRKASGGGRDACCYTCVPCSEGEASSLMDGQNCQKCPDDQWPDDNKIKCIPKTYDFLSYNTDGMVMFFSIATLFGSVVTLFTVGDFIAYRDTPLVKANNRSVSFILLLSLFLSFLTVFLFLGRPVDITCMLRQVLFGIFFTVAVSSVLAKTIMVYIAFKATKPSSSWRKWMGVKQSNSVILTCSSIQVLVGTTWFSISPPFQDLDTQSYLGKIIVQCNEGSVIAFYSMLGYLGLLAAVSFVLAFMVRTLPDSFNEARYITFSMLVFCSVWISMIPAYMSTKGKYMVAVEIFAILTSCAGVFGCIFCPKIYILHLKPELNSRNFLQEKRTVTAALILNLGYIK